jgi:lipoate-protein ligase B
MKHLTVIDIDVIPYVDAWALQKDIVARKKAGIASDYLILAEHTNVLTIGRRGSLTPVRPLGDLSRVNNILADEISLKEEGLEIIYTDRGGDITFHGPGQIVAYPIFDLRSHGKDIRLFIQQLEKVIALTLKIYGIEADKENKYTGSWIGGRKIGFIGIGLSNWITYHGISLNANTDLRYFSMIRPCGIDGVEITSMQKILGRYIDPIFLKNVIVEKFCEVFSFGDHTFAEDAFMAHTDPAGIRLG